MEILLGLLFLTCIGLIIYFTTIKNKKNPKNSPNEEKSPASSPEEIAPLYDASYLDSPKIKVISRSQTAPMTVPEFEYLPRVVPSVLKSFKLMTLDLNDRVTKQKINSIIQMTPRPHPILRALTQEIDSAEELYYLIKDDPKIVAKILENVNGSTFSFQQEITDVNRAIFFLGLRVVQDIALKVALQGNRDQGNKQNDKMLNKIWSTNLLASSLALLLAKNLLLANSQELCTSVLFNSIGVFGLLLWKPSSRNTDSQHNSLLEQVKLEQEQHGLNSAVVGGALAEEWELPNGVISCIKNNLIPLAVPPDECELDREALRNVVFAYTACRIGEQIVNHGIKDIANINFSASEDPDCFYLSEYFKVVGIDSINHIFKDPHFCKRANQIIERMAPAAEPA